MRIAGSVTPCLLELPDPLGHKALCDEDVAKKERAMMLSLIVLLGMGLLQDGDQKASERGFGNLGRLRSLDPLVL